MRDLMGMPLDPFPRIAYPEIAPQFPLKAKRPFTERAGCAGEAIMSVKFDPETLERFRAMTPQQICREVTDAVHRAPGDKGSEDFLEALESLVEEGILSWDQIENDTADDES
jgi:hypothetical protein